MGDSPDFAGDMKMVVKLPSDKAEIKIIRNGKVHAKAEEKEFELKIKSKGVYRVEVYLNGNAWIFSNPIRIL